MTDMILTTLKVAGVFVVIYPVIMTSIVIICKLRATGEDNDNMVAEVA